jgi:ribonuclease J
LRVTDGLVVVLSSPQNIDRVVTTYRAALQADRDLALDLYSCDVVAGTGLATIPQLGPDWPRVHAYLPLHQRIKVKNAAAFEKTQAVRPYRIYDERLSENPERYVLFGSFQQDLLRLLRSANVKVGAVVWSQWEGYLEKASGVKLQETLKKYDVPLIQHHTSGHATPADLERLISAINPTAVVPVHTEHPGEFEGITSDVDLTIKADGHWWEVA